MNQKLSGLTRRYYLPVTLSSSARRAALVATGVQPAPRQVLEVRDLTELEQAERERLVAVSERLSWEPVEGDEDPTTALVDGYDRFRRASRTWMFLDSEDGDVQLDEVFFDTPGRTISLLERLESDSDRRELFEALLAGAPLVDELEDSRLGIAGVLKAYERAFDLADGVAELGRTGWTVGSDEKWTQCAWVGDDGVVIAALLEKGLTPIAFLRASDAKSVEATRSLVQEVVDLPFEIAQQFAHDVCVEAARMQGLKPSDADLFEVVVKKNGQKALDAGAARQRKEIDRDAYEKERQRWIARHGSRRLKLAAERNYKHDGLYRDERLAKDFPGFVGSLGKKREVRELINPTEEALELESEVIRQVQDSDSNELEVRLVWVAMDLSRPFQDGEYLQLTGYLGRHIVYRPVSPPDPNADDIPF